MGLVIMSERELNRLEVLSQAKRPKGAHIAEPLGTALIVITAATSAGLAVCALGSVRFTRRQGQGGPLQSAKE